MAIVVRAQDRRISLTRRRRITAPITAPTKPPTAPPGNVIPTAGSSQPARNAPATPITMSERRPDPVPLTIRLATHPTRAPITTTIRRPIARPPHRLQLLPCPSPLPKQRGAGASDTPHFPTTCHRVLTCGRPRSATEHHARRDLVALRAHGHDEQVAVPCRAIGRIAVRLARVGAQEPPALEEQRARAAVGPGDDHGGRSAGATRDAEGALARGLAGELLAGQRARRVEAAETRALRRARGLRRGGQLRRRAPSAGTRLPQVARRHPAAQHHAAGGLHVAPARLAGHAAAAHVSQDRAVAEPPHDAGRGAGPLAQVQAVAAAHARDLEEVALDETGGRAFGQLRRGAAGRDDHLEPVVRRLAAPGGVAHQVDADTVVAAGGQPPLELVAQRSSPRRRRPRSPPGARMLK